MKGFKFDKIFIRIQNSFQLPGRITSGKPSFCAKDASVFSFVI